MENPHAGPALTVLLDFEAKPPARRSDYRERLHATMIEQLLRAIRALPVGQDDAMCRARIGLHHKGTTTTCARAAASR